VIKMEDISTGKLIAYIGIVLILCIIVFLIAKYIVRDSINWENPPVDVSERI